MSDAERLHERRQRLLGPAYRLFYEQPLHIVRGEGVWLTDADGRRYLDCYNNVPHVGHCHPRVVEAICRQSKILNTHTRYLHETVLDYAERLSALLPGDLNVSMFGCSGTEANELALRIAREATGNTGLIATRHAYHGSSWAISQVSPEDMPADLLEDNVALVDVPASYAQNLTADQATDALSESMTCAIDTLQQRGHAPAACSWPMKCRQVSGVPARISGVSRTTRSGRIL